ncbi:ribonuclease HII [Winogradskyella endarachnes]|uniref:Ribonuclease HII n=1 Tax=Winogradskyella endarachnes TaxID=2681965 RepID=A0A6L6UDU0_9FLAO|nr:ribonuclease HII [Winogradskyella endarachnes]MUU78924.1 ribonuclease HII [Winogradskyella endarachnes]
MKRFGFLSIMCLFLLGCQKDYNKTKLPYHFIPNDTYAVIQINELGDFINNLNNNNILSTIYNNNIKNASKALKTFNTTERVFIAIPDSTETQYLILTKNDSTLLNLEGLKNYSTETLTNLNIKKTTLDNSVLYHQVLGNTFISSNSLELLKTIDSKNENLELSQLIETADKKSVASVVFKSNAKDYSKLLFTDIFNHKTSNLTLLDFKPSGNKLNYNGIITTKDSTLNYLNAFKNTVPQKTNALLIAPQNTGSLTSIAFDDFIVFKNNLNQLTKSKDDGNTEFLNFTNEIAHIDDALVLHTLDPNLLLESIENKSFIEDFREIAIYNFNNPNTFKNKLEPFISFDEANYFSIFENFVIFTSTIDNLKSIITHALNENTLANYDGFNTINTYLSDEASMFIYKDSKGISDILNKTMAGYNANVVQYINENDYTHINGIIQKYKKPVATNSVTEAFTTTLEASILKAPQTVKNHITKAHDIVVQDVNKVLYLISSSGNILWKKQLQGKILGKIEQIDIYKNGRLQLVFATENKVYVLDRNGKDVSSFPMNFNNKITQPLSVFDYDKHKDYRLLVTQGKNLIMYNAKGKIVKGFNYKNNGSEISSQPRHFRIGSKDYITFEAGDHLKILNRQGNTRINVKDKIRFADNDVYLYQNKFTTTNTLGQLVQIDTKGKVSTKNLNLTDKHNIFTTSKTLVTLSENQLNIKSRTLNLDFGEYTAPEIFYLNDKIYVTTTDLQSKKVHLFDSQAKPIVNFPVFGVAPAELQKLDNEKGLELITQSDDKTIVVYKMH